MHNIKSIFIGLFLAIVILVSTAIAVAYFYEEKVSRYLIAELNEYLLAEVEVEEVKFSLLKKFPNASLELKNVVAHSKAGFFGKIQGFNTDTLFFAKSIFIQLNLLDLLSKNYTISSIHFDHGDINLFVDYLGDPNYIFWNEKEVNEDNEFSFALNEVKITQANVLFCNDANNFVVRSKVKRVDFEGNFSNQNYVMKINLDQFTKELSVGEIEYIVNKNTKANLNLDIVNHVISIQNGKLNIDNLKFDINGTHEKHGEQKTDIIISGKNLNVGKFMEQLPSKVIEEFPNIIGQKGSASIDVSISGNKIKEHVPHIEAQFLLNKAQFFDIEREIRLSNIDIEGEFTNGSKNNFTTSKLLFKKFNTNLESNYFEGSLELTNFNNPQIKLDLLSELYFDEVKDIFKLDTIETINGEATAKIKYNGNYDELRNFKLKHILTKDYTVDLSIKNGELKFKNHPLFLNNISGKIDLNRTLYTDNLYFSINESDFLIKGRISKLFEFFNKKEIFNINAKVYSQRVNLNELSLLFQNDTSLDSEAFKFPDKIALQLRLNIENFEAGKFKATEIKGNLNYKPRMFSMHEISFNSMHGKVKAGGVIIQKFNNDFVVKTQSRLTNINMNDLFYSFNNFGQTFITNKNIEGSLDGDVYYSSDWTNKIEVKKETVNSECDLIITEGELNDFEPLLGLSRYIDIEDLKSIKFSTLKNKITISDQQIIVPQMDIESSALNISASGKHYFNSEYEYHVKMLLSDILSGKMRSSKRKKQSDEKIQEDDDGRVILYLLLEGDKEKSKVKYDRKAARNVRKENMKTERRELRQMLNEEFGWFKKDSSLNQELNNDPTGNEFSIEFEESNDPKKDKKQEKLNPSQKFEIEWEEDTTDMLIQ